MKNSETPVEIEKAPAKQENNIKEEKDKDKELEILQKQFRQNYRGFCSKYDLIIIIGIIFIVYFVWVYIYKQPIPFGILRILGMDDTLYPEQYEKYQKNLWNVNSPFVGI